MSRVRTAVEWVASAVGLIILSPVLAVCAAFVCLSLVIDEHRQRRDVRRVQRMHEGWD